MAESAGELVPEGDWDGPVDESVDGVLESVVDGDDVGVAVAVELVTDVGVVVGNALVPVALRWLKK